MRFLDGHPDLTDTIFTGEHLRSARAYLESAINRVDPAWLKKPQGRLGIHWQTGGQSSTCYLVAIAHMLHQLERNMTAKSVPVLGEKFKGLLHPPSEQQYDEWLTELQVMAQFSERVSPLALDPFVPEGLSGRRPRSPDFAIRLPDGDVFVEITVVHMGFIDRWDRSMMRIAEMIQASLRKKRLSRSVHLQVPIGEDLAGRRPWVESLACKIAATETGRDSFAVKGGSVFVEWTLPEVMPPGVNRGRSVVGVAWQPTTDAPGLAEHILKSLRNTLNRKREQFPYEAPYLLVAKLGHHRMQAQGVERLVRQRIWPNPDYGWITGLVHFTPRTGFTKDDPPSSLMLWPNPNARSPASPPLCALFEGTEAFHLP